MGSYRLGVLAGDGIGPEIVTASVAVVDAAIARAGVDAIEWHELPFGAAALEEFGVHTPEVTLTTLEGLDGWLLGPHDSVSYPEPHRSLLNPSGTVRKHFGLYANIRPAKAFEGGKAIVPGTDLVIMHGIITRAATERIARVAFELATRRRNKVTIVHKANVLKMTTGLFRDVCREVAREYPQIEVDDFHIGAADEVHGHRVDVEVVDLDLRVLPRDLAADVAEETGGHLEHVRLVDDGHLVAATGGELE